MTRRLLIVCALLCLQSACMPQVKSLPHPQPLKDDLLQRLDETRAAFLTVKGLAKATYRNGDESITASQVVFARYPAALRLETLGLFGSPALLLATDGTTLTVLLPGEAKAYQGPAGAGFLQQVLRLPLRPEDLVSLLLHKPLQLPWGTSQVVYEDDGRSRLILENDFGLRQELVFDRDLRLVQCEYRLAGIRQLLVVYTDFDDPAGFPRRIHLTLPQDHIEALLAFSSLESNVELTDSRFVLTPPVGYAVEPLPGN